MSDSGPATPPISRRARAVEEALRERGMVPEGFFERFHETATEKWHPRNGARVVARAWLDPAFRERLLADGTAACAELGYGGPQGEYIVALEDTPALHHVIVCTQCSCTAWPVLGLPPDWYKSFEYRARVVDTTAETRFLVLPLRPAGTEGWSEDELAAIVTREAMIGVAMVTLPAGLETPGAR
jgi:nitrile hydratase subunit alpha